MHCEEIHLKDRFPFLGEDGKDPVLKAYLPYDKDPIKCQNVNRPSILLCPVAAIAPLPNGKVSRWP